jgi:serine/threonine-protein kinase
LNPNLALARAWYSNFLISRGRWEEAIAQVRRAEQIDPFSLVVVTNVGWTMSNARRPHDAIAAYRRALSIDPSYIQARMRLGSELANIGQFEEAIREHQQVVDMTRRGAFGLASLAQSYAKAGRRTEATAILRELLDVSQRTYVSPVNMYLIYFLLGEWDNGFEWLAKAFQERSNGLVYLTAEPSLDVIRHDPRFRQVVAQVGLPDVP